MSQTKIILATLIAYTAVLIIVGLWASRRVNNETDFLLGGRKLGAWVAGLSYAASTSSAWILLGFTGFVFNYGLSALWMVLGIWGGYILMWAWCGPSIRSESKINQWITPTEVLCATMDKKSKKILASLAAFLISFCFIFYIAGQFDAAAVAFTSNFQLNSTYSLIVSAVIILIYCLLGGFWAASITDTIQAVMIMMSAIIVPVATIIEAGGLSRIFSTLDQMNPIFMDWTGGHEGFILLGLIMGAAGIGFGTFGQPHLLARLMAVKGERERKLGFLIAMIWVIIVYVGMSLLGLGARSLMLQPGSGEQIFYLLAEKLLPPVLAGIVIASILSAIMSTIDSLLLAASAAISHDLELSDYFKLDKLWISRFVMTCIVIAAILLAMMLPDSIFNRVLFAWSALGAAFGPIIIARVMSYEPSFGARLWSIITGFSVTVLFYTYGNISMDEVSSSVPRLLVYFSHLPGDPFERFIPFVLSLSIVLLWPILENNKYRNLTK